MAKVTSKPWVKTKGTFGFVVLAFLSLSAFLFVFTSSKPQTLQQRAASSSPIKTVFVILMENHNWVDIKAGAPYITNTLLPMGAHAEQYYNPPGIHPSEPNYIWLEAGTNLGVTDDNDPSVNHQSTANHLVSLLTSANISWKAYAENINGTNCPLNPSGLFAPRHTGMLFFDDVTNTSNPQSQNCITHIRPYTELAADLQGNKVSQYNFITPNLCNDMHDCSIATGDTWLSTEVPKIMSSAAYQNGGAIFITWDEGEGGVDGPIGMVVLSPLAKKGYQNTIHYTHSSTLRTMEEIFGVSPMLGDAANATDLSDLFSVSLAALPSASAPVPTSIYVTPSTYCIGSCIIPTNTPQPSMVVPSVISTQAPSVNPSSMQPTIVLSPGGGDNNNSKHTHGGDKGFLSGIITLLLSLIQLIIQIIGKLFAK